MKKVRAVPAPDLRRPALYPVVLGYVAITVVVTTLLLFKSDDLISQIIRYEVGGGRFGAAVAVLVAAAGVLSLPYLLRMQVSPLMRIVSFVASFVAPFGWLLGAWWVEVNFGGKYGLILILATHAGLLLALFSAWIVGLPFKPLKKHQ